MILQRWKILTNKWSIPQLWRQQTDGQVKRTDNPTQGQGEESNPLIGWAQCLMFSVGECCDFSFLVAVSVARGSRMVPLRQAPQRSENNSLPLFKARGILK